MPHLFIVAVSVQERLPQPGGYDSPAAWVVGLFLDSVDVIVGPCHEAEELGNASRLVDVQLAVDGHVVGRLHATCPRPVCGPSRRRTKDVWRTDCGQICVLDVHLDEGRVIQTGSPQARGKQAGAIC